MSSTFNHIVKRNRALKGKCSDLCIYMWKILLGIWSMYEEWKISSTQLLSTLFGSFRFCLGIIFKVGRLILEEKKRQKPREVKPEFWYLLLFVLIRMGHSNYVKHTCVITEVHKRRVHFHVSKRQPEMRSRYKFYFANLRHSERWSY